MMTRLSLVAVTLLAAFTFAAADDKADEQRAELGSKGLLQACEAYQNNPQNATMAYPTILTELVKPPFGGTSFLRNGEKDLRDPWG
ncbi:hypothetical protein [Frigoriglobus tundricola]|uniref:Uncharacterized protein n=1 Tax=Frigoriglobus tundricola TaxID=2774151 RepID=A0A6M5YXA0_9BACT|nr:hypothetical protein [Frigoriglobus tundricola]QJW97833.1 hypothetical protein FTUN_5413 [Frigoriglobus tundricola]